MARNRYSPVRRISPGTAILVLLLHIAALFGLARAFAPGFVDQVIDRASSTLTVTVTTRPPDPPPAQEPDQPRSPEPEGASAPPGEKARPRETAAPVAKAPIATEAAPPAASTGTENRSGSADAGAGSGAGGPGQGTGAGGSGTGPGGGGSGGTGVVKIAGEINSARDYPAETRDIRIGHRVVLALTVGVDGRVKSCRIHRPSPDTEADRITCRLATERFRFRPATNAQGDPVESVYGWEQRWFNPGDG